jgi:hypothetical protein
VWEVLILMYLMVLMEERNMDVLQHEGAMPLHPAVTPGQGR